MLLNILPNTFSFDESLYIKKLHNELLSKAKKNTAKRCLICDREVKSYCKSHSVPHFCLRNISQGKNLNYINSIIMQPTMKKDQGAGEAGVFYTICNDCDSKEFLHYENPELYTEKIDVHILNEIAKKNYLQEIEKRRYQKNYYELMMKNYFELYVINNLDALHKVEINDYESFSKEYVNLTDNKTKFNILFYKKLDYVVPFAFQDDVCLVSDFNGDLINNVYRDSKLQQSMFVCIFPLKESTILLMFCNEKNNKYRKFKKQFNKLNLENKLKTFLFIMMAYSDNFFFSHSISNTLLSDEYVKEISGYTIMSQVVGEERDLEKYKTEAIKEAMMQFNLSKVFKLENYMSIEYKM